MARRAPAEEKGEQLWLILEAGPKGAPGTVRPLSKVNDWTREYATIAREPFRFKATDGREIEGLLVRPAGTVPGRTAPLLVVVHGGPAGVFSNSFSVRRGVYPVQLFAQKGFVVLMPNPRGSGGYGEAFRKDTLSFTGVTDIPPFMRSYFGAWPWDDPSVYMSHTATYNARGITAPTLIHTRSSSRS